MQRITLEEVRSWPATVDVSTAARVLGISRSYAFELAKRDQLPCRLLKVGSRYRVPTHSLIALLEGNTARESA